jgi:hypothetical protein
VLANANPPVPKVGQGLVHDGLPTLLCHLNGMHVLTPQIEKRYGISNSPD